VGIAATGIAGILVARTLGPVGKGDLAFLVTLSGIAIQITNFGIHSSNTFYFGRSPQHLGSILYYCYLAIVSSGILTGLGFICFNAALRQNPAYSTEIAILIVLSVPIGLTFLFSSNLLLAQQRIHAYNVFEVADKLSYLLFAFALFLVPNLGVVFIFMAPLVPRLFLGLWYFAAANKTVTALKAFPRNDARNYFIYGMKTFVATLLMFLILHSDILMIHWYIGGEETGTYSAAVALLEFCYMPAVVFSTLLFPRLVLEVTNRDKWIMMWKLTPLVGFVSLVLITGLVVFSESVVFLLFGIQFARAAEIIPYLAPGILFLSINTLFMNFFASVNLPPMILLMLCLAAVLNFLLNLFAIPALGGLGAAIASSITYGAMLTSSFLYRKRCLVH
jgi:O-antigen/teichoic acid export membrane protein